MKKPANFVATLSRATGTDGSDFTMIDSMIEHYNVELDGLKVVITLRLSEQHHGE